jgi:hypothetical protein
MCKTAIKSRSMNEFSDMEATLQRLKAELAEVNAELRRKPWWVRFIVKVWSLFAYFPDHLERMRLRLTILNCDLQMARLDLRRLRARLLLRIADALEAVLDRIERRS